MANDTETVECTDKSQCTCKSTNSVCVLQCDYCEWSELNCGSFNTCNVLCTNKGSCENAKIISTTADVLIICSGNDACSNISLFCGSNNCTVQCNTSRSCDTFIIFDGSQLICEGFCDSISYIQQTLVPQSQVSTSEVSISTEEHTLHNNQRKSKVSTSAEERTLHTLNGSLTIFDDNHDIGWIKAANCRNHSASFIDSTTPFQDFDGFVHFSQYAISFRLVPCASDNILNATDYAVETAICSNPIYNLNRGKELSFITDINTGLISGFADIERDWIGTETARHRLQNRCYGDTGGIGYPPRNLSRYIYNSCEEGIQIQLDETCSWTQANNAVCMDIYIGFDANLSAICINDGNGNYVYNKSIISGSLHTSDSTGFGDIEETHTTAKAIVNDSGFSVSLMFFVSIIMMMLVCCGCLITVKSIIKYLWVDISGTFVVKPVIDHNDTRTAIDINVNVPTSLTMEEQKYPPDYEQTS